MKTKHIRNIFDIDIKKMITTHQNNKFKQSVLSKDPILFNDIIDNSDLNEMYLRSKFVSPMVSYPNPDSPLQNAAKYRNTGALGAKGRHSDCRSPKVSNTLSNTDIVNIQTQENKHGRNMVNNTTNTITNTDLTKTKQLNYFKKSIVNNA